MIIVLSLFNSLSPMFSFRLIKRRTLFQLCTSPVIDKTVVCTICIYTLSRTVSFAIFGEVSGYILPDYTILCLHSLTSTVTWLLPQWSLELINLLCWTGRIEWCIWCEWCVNFHWIWLDKNINFHKYKLIYRMEFIHLKIKQQNEF